jgi:hypothetical protein
VATFAVLGWRLVNFWLPIPVGAATYTSLRLGRGAGFRDRRRALSTMVEEARSSTETPFPYGSIVMPMQINAPLARHVDDRTEAPHPESEEGEDLGPTP